MLYLTYKNGIVIKLTLEEFETAKINNTIKIKDLIQIEGKFTLLQQLAFGVYNFRNELSLV